MVRLQQPSPTSQDDAGAGQPTWCVVLRAIREARGVTQDGWGAWLGYSRSTIRRWEHGEQVPDLRAEEALLQACREHGLFRSYAHGPLAGHTLTPAFLQALLAEARLGDKTGWHSSAADAPMGQLTVDNEEVTTSVYRLQCELTRIGREPDNDIVIANGHISRHHAEVRWQAGKYMLYDLGSKNGILLNGERVIAPKALSSGDVITLATFALTFSASDSTLTLGSISERDT